jgi:hypothetical protein
MFYSLTTAAAAAGINRTTVFRAIKTGRISAQRDSNGQWQLDPSEFHRVFPPLPAAATSSQQAAHHGEQHGAMTDSLVATLNKVIDDLRRGQDDLRADRDRWQSQSDHWREAYESTQRLIPALLQQHAPPETTEAIAATTPAPSSGQRAEATPVARPVQNRKQRMLKFWFGTQYRRRAG